MDIIEGHPIPQDITGFQFRIIGDLTIKQFAYLAVGLLFGWIFFSIPIPFIIKIPLAVIVAGTGIIFAFVPIQGRSADTMLMLFIKAVLNVNEYTYQKQQMLSTTQQAPLSQPSGEQIVTGPTAASTQPTHSPISPQKDEGTMAATFPITTTTLPGSEQQAGQPEHVPAVLDLTKQLEDTKQEKQRLEEQLLQLQQQLQQKPQQVLPPVPTTLVAAPANPVLDDVKRVTGAPLSPEVPNLILGVVKDSRGNVLPNILIEVKDRDENPVRAFKTNPLGQFASATPLLNGTYSITFEDPKKQQQFDTLKVTADGTIIDPLEVISVDERENLRKSLFGG